MEAYDVPSLELVLNLIVTCSRSIPMGANDHSKDGIREEIWPILGVRF